MPQHRCREANTLSYASVATHAATTAKTSDQRSNAAIEWRGNNPVLCVVAVAARNNELRDTPRVFRRMLDLLVIQ